MPLVLALPLIGALLAQQPAQQALSPASRQAAQPTLPTAAPQPIVLDARFDDWKDIKPVLVDPADAPDSAVDLGEIRIACDNNFVHLLIDFGKTVNVHGLDGTAEIILNADGDDNTGAETNGVKGADVIIVCTPPNREHPASPGHGIAIRSTTYQSDPADSTRPALNPYDIGLAFAPAYAARRIEFQIARGNPAPPAAGRLPPLFLGRNFTGKVIFQNLANVIADETDAFTFELKPRPATASTQPDDVQQPRDPLARSDGTALRIMSWNAELGAIISRSEPFVRTIDALQPDVILLQELTDKNTEQQVLDVLARLNFNDAGHQWHAIIGKGGGDLRCAVLSRLPIANVATLEMVAPSDRPDRGVRVAGAMVDIGGKKLLAVSVHLKCCGRAGSSEDQTRLAEVTLLHERLRETLDQTTPDGLVITGDFNLVGSRQPLEDMMTGLDLDASVMGMVDAYQIDGRSNATWSDRRQPFAPGKLDYALYSDSDLRVGGCFVYDAWDLAPKWRAAHGTHPDDTDLASDHLPVVFDLAWK